METLDGIKIENLGFNPKRLGDLLYHEGPLLSHFINEDNRREHYFYKWTDSDDKCNRWLIFRIQEQSLIAFFEKKKSLLQLIMQSPFVYFVDLDNDLAQKQLVLTSPDKIPGDYLPLTHSFFTEKQYENYALKMRDDLLQEASGPKTGSLMSEILNIKKEVMNIKSALGIKIRSSNDISQ